MNENDEEIARINRELLNPNREINVYPQIGVGLRGLSNSCSLNSILQVLFHINVFRHYVFYLRETRVSDSYIALEFQKIFIQLCIKGSTPPSVKQLLFKLKIPFEDLIKNNDPLFYLHRIYNILRNDDFFRNLFIGLISKSNKNAYFLSLSLNVDLGDNIESIFGQMFSSLQFNRFPPIIFINLDRYKSNNVNHKFVSFPTSLNLTGYMPNGSPANYELCSVIVHSGRNKNGHFFVYINEGDMCNWVLYDDSNVKMVSQNEAIEENFGGDEKYYSAKVLVYYDTSMKDIIFEPDSIDYAATWILDKFSSEDAKAKSSLSLLNTNSRTNREYKINVVRLRDVTKHLDSDASIKFTSDKYISVFQNESVKELYNKMATFLRSSIEKLTIWIIFRSVLSLKIIHKYDNEPLSKIIEPMKNIQFFVEVDEEEEEEDVVFEENEDLDKRSNKEEKNKKQFIKKEKDENSDNDDNSIIVFLFTYNHMNSKPLYFYGTVIIGYDENIDTLFNISRKKRSNRSIKSDTKMVAFQIIDQKCYLIADPTKTVGSLELSDGSIIVVQPYVNFSKSTSGSKPKKTKSAHNVFTYCPDYINSLPHSFSIYFEYKKDPYNLPLKYNHQRKMVEFPKCINCEDFKNFVLKAYNIDLNPDYESILFYGKLSTKPLNFVPSLNIGEQIDNFRISEDLDQLYLVKVLSNEVDDYYNMIRLKIKMNSFPKKKGLTEFFDKDMFMLDVVNELKKKYDDLSNYFILPLNSSKEIIPENFVIENIRNPIIFNLRQQSDIYITMILIVNGKEIKEIDVRVDGDDTFLDFKNKLNIINTKDARFYTIGENGNQKNISDSQLMKKYGHFKAIIYFESPFIPILLEDMIARPLLNTVHMTYESQIFPNIRSESNKSSFSRSKENSINKSKSKKEIDILPSFTDPDSNNSNTESEGMFLCESEYENGNLLINDQFNSSEVDASEMKILDLELREKLKDSRQFNKMFPMKEDIHLFYTDNIVSSFYSESQLEPVIYDKDELLKTFYFQPRVKKNSPSLLNNNNNNNNSTTDNEGETPTETVQIEEKRGRGRPKKIEVVKTESEDEKQNDEKIKEVEILKIINNSSNNNNIINISNNEDKNDDENDKNEPSSENSQQLIKSTRKSSQIKKIQVEENKPEEEPKIDEENYSNYVYDKSDNDINYEENEDYEYGEDDDEDDDDEAVTFEDSVEDDDYEIDDEDDVDITYIKKVKKTPKGNKKKKQNDDRNTNNNNNNNNRYRNGIQIIPGSSIGAIFRGRNNAGFFSGQPIIIQENHQQQSAIPLRGTHSQIAAQLRNLFHGPVSSFQTQEGGNGNGPNFGDNNNDPTFVIIKKGNPTIVKVQHNPNDGSSHPFVIGGNAENPRNIELGIPNSTKVATHSITQLPQAFSGNQRIEIIQSGKHFHQTIPELQQEHQQDQHQRSVIQAQPFPPEIIQKQNERQQQQQNFKGHHQSVVFNYPHALIKNLQQQQQQQQPPYQSSQQQHQQQPPYQSSQQQQHQQQPPYQSSQQQRQQQQSYQSSQQQQQQQQKQQPYQSSQQQQQSYQSSQQQKQQQYQSIKQSHPQPQIRTQPQNKQLQVFPYSKPTPEVQQKHHNFQANNNEMNSQQSQKKKIPFAGNRSNIDEIINVTQPDDFVDGRSKTKNDNDSNQNRNAHPNVNKTRQARFLDIRPNSNSMQIYENTMKLNAKKIDIDNNIGYIRDPASYDNNNNNNNLSVDHSSRLGNDLFSDASSRLQFPRNPFTLNSFKLMPTHETELVSINQGDDTNKKQKDQNNRNRQNDPSQYSRFSDFSPSNDDFFHPL